MARQLFDDTSYGRVYTGLINAVTCEYTGSGSGMTFTNVSKSSNSLNNEFTANGVLPVLYASNGNTTLIFHAQRIEIEGSSVTIFYYCANVDGITVRHTADMITVVV